MHQGNCGIKEFVIELSRRSAKDATNASGDFYPLSLREEIEKDNILAISLAKELNLWMPYTDVLSYLFIIGYSPKQLIL